MKTSKPKIINFDERFNGRLTDRQREALALLSAFNRVLLYGGARSGKTFLIVCVVLLRAMKYPGSRHLIARLRYAHARASVWLDTLPAAVKFLGIEAVVEWKESDHYLAIKGKGGAVSEIWVDGLDDRDRIDKILGREYATIYLNEVSQIPWGTVTTVLTRLAQNIPGCVPKLFLDENPPSKFHWTNRLFIQGVDPETGAAVDRTRYGSLQVNPQHNAANLPAGYIEDNLASLPEHKRRRFLEGEFGDAEGVIFKNWDIIENIPDEVKAHSRVSYGLDFGFSVDPAAAVEVRLNGDDLYVDELLYSSGLTNSMLAVELKKTGKDGPFICDSSEPKSIRELSGMGLKMRAASKGPDSVRAGIDWLLSKRLHVTRRSVSLQAELENYCWRENREGRPMPEPIDDYNHCIAEGQRVLTARGLIPIEDINLDDMVMTREGYRRVIKCGQSGSNAKILKVVTDNGTLYCTPCHKIYLQEGLARADAIRYNNHVIGDQSWLLKSECSKAIPTDVIPKARTFQTEPISRGQHQGEQVTCIGTCGSLSMAPSLTGSISIMPTVTLATIISPTLKAYLQKIIAPLTRGMINGSECNRSILKESAPSLKYGIEAKREGQSTGRLGHWLIKTLSPSKSPAPNADILSRLKNWGIKIYTALTSARVPQGGRAGLMMNQESAPIAGQHSPLITTVEHDAVVGRVLTVSEAGIAPKVYDLTIEHTHEFFCENILVSNSIDAIRYGCEPWRAVRPVFIGRVSA